MDEAYTKLAKGIVYSSVWGEDSDTCKVWVTLLALKNRDNVVTENLVGISRLINLSVDVIQAALDKFQAPDPESKSKVDGGRRIRRVPEGWFIVNGDVYNELGWSEEKKIADRERKRRWRAKQQSQVNSGVASVEFPPGPIDIIEFGRHCTEILNFLSEQTGSKFLHDEETIQLIADRLSDVGGDLDGVKKMICRQCLKWKGDPKSVDWLCPSTLFKKQKFGEYYASKDLPVLQPDGKPPRTMKIVGPNAQPATPGGF